MEDPLDLIRPLMTAHSPPLDALIVPSEDNHQSEYVSERDKRRQFVSGFTGSAGLVLITMKEALLWTDGRYFLQAAQQLSDRWKLMRIGEDPPVENWISENLQAEAIVGIDPWVVSVDNAHKYEQTFSQKKQILFQLSSDLVDKVWKERPPAKFCPVVVHPIVFSGHAVAEKLKDLRVKMLQEKAYCIIITALDEVAWLYNIRGNDVDYCPVVHAYAVVTTNAAFLYVDNQKVSPEVRSYLTENGIDIRDYDMIAEDLKLLAAGEHRHPVALGMGGNGKESETHERKGIEDRNHNKVWIDQSSCSLAIYSSISDANIVMQPSPLSLAKALKNPTELDGFRKSHIRDGAAVVQYLVWLDGQMQQIYGAAGYFQETSRSEKKEHLEKKLTEVSVSDKLESFRAKQEHFRGLSFPTISSVGANAAVIHYAPEVDTCLELDPEKIYLFDSGAQYLDGTTDVTRSVHFGKPSEHEKSCYTAVLKGHIALDNAVFPNGTTGHALDILSRVPLWKNGLDYRHGTGHGVGSYLYVHEGPHLISFRPSARNVPLQPSMTVTDEPGYYEDGNFGIRLENVLIVKEATTEFNFGDKGYLAFEHITWVPYQKKLMKLDLMTPGEIHWVNSYHSDCRRLLAPLLNKEELEWLVKATEAITVGE